MLLQAIGAGLPAALAIALSPFPVIGIVLLLVGPHGRLNGPLFAAGWLVGLSVVTAIVVGRVRRRRRSGEHLVGNRRLGTGTGGSDPHRPGGAQVAGSTTTGRCDRRADLDGIDRCGDAGQGAGSRCVLSGANPKNFVLAAAAATSIVEAGVHGTELVVAVAVFVLVGSFTVIGAVVVHWFGGRWGAALLDSVRQFMVANSAVITVFILMILGAKVLGDGLIGLGR